MAYGGWINGVWATGLRRLGSLSSPIVWPGLSNFPLLFLNIYIYSYYQKEGGSSSSSTTTNRRENEWDPSKKTKT